MKKPNITQGNWAAFESIRGGYTIWADHRDCVVRDTDEESRYGSIEKKEDATAIAAVPDLLDLMVRAVNRLEIAHRNGDSIMKEWIIDAKSALLKAGCTDD